MSSGEEGQLVENRVVEIGCPIGGEDGDNLRCSSGMERVPMIPAICNDLHFLYCTDLQLEEHAANPVLVASLLDSLKCWLSHIRDIYGLIASTCEHFDESDSLSIPEVAKYIRRIEAETSFFLHFDRLEPTVVRRCLKSHPPAVPLLEQLEVELTKLKATNEQYKATMELMDMAAAYFPDGTWPMQEISDSVPPLFSALKAVYMCSDSLGAAHPTRFMSLVKFTISSSENAIETSCGNAIQRILKWPKCALTVAGELVAAQDASVSVQESYHNLRLNIVEYALDPLQAEALFSAVDDEAMFSVLEWQYHRCTAIIHLVDALRKDENKIGSALTDPLENIDLMNPAHIDQERLLALVDNIVTKDAPNPSAVLERMGVRSGVGAPVQHAPRAAFDELTGALTITVRFNPPVVTIIGGPVSDATLDAATKALPQCCSNKGVISLRRTLAACTWKPVPLPASHTGGTNRHGPVLVMEIHEQFCDIEISQSHFLVTLLDLLEAEEAWAMTDCHTYDEGAQTIHTLMFRRQRIWDEKDE